MRHRVQPLKAVVVCRHRPTAVVGRPDANGRAAMRTPKRPVSFLPRSKRAVAPNRRCALGKQSPNTFCKFADRFEKEAPSIGSPAQWLSPLLRMVSDSAMSLPARRTITWYLRPLQHDAAAAVL